MPHWYVYLRLNMDFREFIPFLLLCWQIWKLVNGNFASPWSTWHTVQSAEIIFSLLWLLICSQNFKFRDQDLHSSVKKQPYRRTPNVFWMWILTSRQNSKIYREVQESEKLEWDSVGYVSNITGHDCISACCPVCAHWMKVRLMSEKSYSTVLTMWE